MKKIIVFAITSFMLLGAPWGANAATLSFSPATINVTKGQSFTMAVALNPQGTAVYTARAEVQFPAHLLEVTSFAFAAPNWQPLTQPKYDVLDNTKGLLVKTAGYPGGTSSQVTFGTVSFLAKGSGSGVVQIAAGSAVYDRTSQNVLAGAPAQASIAVQEFIAPSPTTPTPPSTPTQALPPASSPAPIAEEVEEELLEEGEEVFAVETEEAGEEVGVPQTSLLAAAGDIVSLGTGNVFAGIAFLVALGLIGYIWFNRFRKKRSSKNRI